MQRHGAAVRRTSKRLTFSEHGHGLVTGQRPPGTPKGPEVLAGFDPAFNRPVILFDQVIEVTPDPMPARFV